MREPLNPHSDLRFRFQKHSMLDHVPIVFVYVMYYLTDNDTPLGRVHTSRVVGIRYKSDLVPLQASHCVSRREPPPLPCHTYAEVTPTKALFGLMTQSRNAKLA